MTDVVRSRARRAQRTSNVPHPAQNAKFRHLLTLEFYSDNLDLDDWSRALEGPYDERAAQRYVAFEHRDAGLGNLKTRILDHDISPARVRLRSRLPVVRRAVCNDCEKKRPCFQMRLRGHDLRWACVEDCAEKAWQRGWRIVQEAALNKQAITAGAVLKGNQAQ